MRQRDKAPKHPRHPFAVAASAAAFFCLALLAASSASASFEQPENGCFAGGLPGKPCAPVAEEKFSEEVQLGGVGGMAVNYTGAGGVPAGTVYAITLVNTGTTDIAMFVPKADGGLEFRQRWEIAFEAGAYLRCGPALGTQCEPKVSALAVGADVDVDQTTGNVYALQGQGGRIVEYSADGSEEITRFGEKAESGKTTAETPSQIHESSYAGGLAVNGAGEIYVFDLNIPDNFYRRLMVFKPQSPGDFGHYVYAGEVEAGFQGVEAFPTAPVTDAAGHIYTAGIKGGGVIREYAPEAPHAYPAPPSKPICSYEYPKNGITAMTVDPLGEDVFFFGERIPKAVHRLGPCDEASGKFTEIEPEPEAFTVAPQRDDLYALAFDPLREFSAGRPPGVLYGGAPSPEPSGFGKGEPGQSSLGYIFTHPEEIPPEVKSESVSHVTATTALLGAQVNPKGTQTTTVFQYLTTAEYEANPPTERFAGAMEAPPGGAILGNANEVLSAAGALAGLTPDTAYHYRVLATSPCSKEKAEKGELCEAPGLAQSFRTFPLEAPGLADHRAYELVSPADKHGGQVWPVSSQADPCINPFIRCVPGSQYPHPRQVGPGGGSIAYAGSPFSPSEGAVAENQYLSRRTDSGWQTTNLTPPLLRTGAGYQALATGLQAGVLSQTPPTLSPQAPANYPNLYTHSTADPLTLTPLVSAAPPNREEGEGANRLQLAYNGASDDLTNIFFRANDALTKATGLAPEALDGGPTKFNLYQWSEGQLALVNVLPGNTTTEPGASFAGTPGTHTISADGRRAFWTSEAGQLYAREDGEVTKPIPGPGKFLLAAADGSKVTLSDGRVYDLETETATDLTQGKSGFQGLVGNSEDLSRVYFVDTAVLTAEEENEEGAKAQGGKFNLYAWDGGATTFIATLSAGGLTAQHIAFTGDFSDWAYPFDRSAQASPAGRYLAFLSQAPLSGYDNTGPCYYNYFFAEIPCPEAFLYDSATQKLTCASCNRSGTSPLGEASLPLINGMPQPHYLTDSGRLYFNSQDQLLPADTNGRTEDVYQWEAPAGSGQPQGNTCQRAEGCLSLISAGHEAFDSTFLGADEEGANVFFTARDQLVLKDKDELYDLYDAREFGGIAAETETARSECQGEACLPQVAPPNDPTPGSSSFEGPGNVVEPKASKKHKHKKHAKKHKRSHKRAAKHNRGGAK